MKPFDYVRALGPGDATAAGGREGAAFIAGGTNLLLWMPLGLQGFSDLLDM